MYRTSNQLGSSAAGRTLVAVGRRAAPPGEHPVSKEGSPARAGGVRGLQAGREAGPQRTALPPDTVCALCTAARRPHARHDVRFKRGGSRLRAARRATVAKTQFSLTQCTRLQLLFAALSHTTDAASVVDLSNVVELVPGPAPRYTPSKISVRAGNSFHDLREIKVGRCRLALSNPR